MAFVYRKHIKNLYIIFFLILLNNCQLRDPNKAHGINFLENREKTLVIGETNQNDVIKLIGNPHSKSIKDENNWIYFERTITRGKLIKLGQNVLKENNILELKFDKYGILVEKKIHNKDDMNKIAYSNKSTENDIAQKSFVSKFLSSVKQKMYGQKKF
jgi:outer membrane protein assembly factor BamE (lipoprotein component of BamABCDE complex)